MQQIRARAIDGLLALPRIGMGVGGLLLGSSRNGVVRLLNSIEIPCSHSAGPSFNLTEAERKHVAQLIAGLAGTGVIGWYCSKTRGAPLLSDSEMALYRELCPGLEQIALVIKPSTIVPVRAAFFCRDSKGQVLQAIECDLDESTPPETQSESDPEPRPEKSIPAASAMIAPVASHVRESLPPPPDPEVAPLPQPRTPPPPAPPIAPRKGGISGWILALAACLALAAAAYLTQNTWRPRPPLALTSGESNGKIAIRWNADALRGINRASLSINDGGNLDSVPLEGAQLNQGLYVYSPKSQRVTARLSYGDVSAITVWFAPEPKPPATPVAADPAPPVQSPAVQTPKPAAHEPVYDDR